MVTQTAAGFRTEFHMPKWPSSAAEPTTDVRAAGADHEVFHTAPCFIRLAGPFVLSGSFGTSSIEEISMAKEHRRGNREVRKPKMKKETAVAPVTMLKAAAVPLKIPKKN